MKTIITLIASFYLLCPLYSIADSSNETIETSNELIGKWKLVNFRCENNREPSGFEQELKYYLSLKPTLEFQTNGNVIQTMSFNPSEVIHTTGNVTVVEAMGAMVMSSLTCVTNITSPYTLSEKVINEHIKDATLETACSIDESKVEAQILTLIDQLAQVLGLQSKTEAQISTLTDTDEISTLTNEITDEIPTLADEINQGIVDEIEAIKKEIQTINQEFEIQGDKVSFYYEKSLPQSVTGIDCEDSRAVFEYERI